MVNLWIVLSKASYCTDTALFSHMQKEQLPMSLFIVYEASSFVEESFWFEGPGLTPKPFVMMYGPKITINLYLKKEIIAFEYKGRKN